MTKKKAKIPNDYVYEGRYLIELLHRFYHDNDGERLIALPSLNDYSPGLFDVYKSFIEDEDDDDPDDPDSVEMSQIEMGGKIRILTDVLNYADWAIIRDFSEYSEIEIRHVKDLNMHLYVHLGQKHAFNIFGPMRFDAKIIDYDQDFIGFESSSDYKICQRFFENLWENAEPITCEKIEHLNQLAGRDGEDSFGKELLEQTYFLFLPGKKNDDEMTPIRIENEIDRCAFSGDIVYRDNLISLAYFVGIKIPRDARQIIICGIDKRKDLIEFSQIFRVFADNPIREIDDTLYFYYPERGFSIIQNWFNESNCVDTYARPKRYYSKNIYMALKTFHFMIDSNKTRKFTKKLNAKFRKDAAFRDALKETYFVKWSDALEGA